MHPAPIATPSRVQVKADRGPVRGISCTREDTPTAQPSRRGHSTPIPPKGSYSTLGASGAIHDATVGSGVGFFQRRNSDRVQNEPVLAAVYAFGQIMAISPYSACPAPRDVPLASCPTMAWRSAIRLPKNPGAGLFLRDSRKSTEPEPAQPLS